MKEKNFVTIINNSIKAAGGFSYKIPDSPFIPEDVRMRFTGKKPFDIIASIDFGIWFIEAKFSRGICGFSEKILRPHQKDNLLLIDSTRPPEFVYPVVFYCCYIPRQIKRIYIFHIQRIIAGKISKKELENDFPYLCVQPTRYRKPDKKTGELKLVKEDLFNPKNMKDYIIILKEVT